METCPRSAYVQASHIPRSLESARDVTGNSAGDYGALVARDPPARSTRDGFLTARQKVKVCSTHGDTPVTHAQANGVAFAMTVKAEGARVRVVYCSVVQMCMELENRVETDSRGYRVVSNLDSASHKISHHRGTYGRELW